MLGWKFKLRLGRIKKRRGIGLAKVSALLQHGSGRPHQHQATPQERSRTRARRQVLVQTHKDLQRSPHPQRVHLYQKRPQGNTPARRVGGRVLRPVVVPPHLQLPNGKIKSNSLRVHWRDDGHPAPRHASWSPVRPQSAPRTSCCVMEEWHRAHRYQLWRQRQAMSLPAPCVVGPPRCPHPGPRPQPPREYGGEDPRGGPGGEVFVLGGKAVSMGQQNSARALSWPGDEAQVCVVNSCFRYGVHTVTTRGGGLRLDNTWPRYDFLAPHRDRQRPPLTDMLTAKDQKLPEQKKPKQNKKTTKVKAKTVSAGGLSRKYKTMGTIDMYWSAASSESSLPGASDLDPSGSIAFPVGSQVYFAPEFGPVAIATPMQHHHKKSVNVKKKSDERLSKQNKSESPSPTSANIDKPRYPTSKKGASTVAWSPDSSVTKVLEEEDESQSFDADSLCEDNVPTDNPANSSDGNKQETLMKHKDDIHTISVCSNFTDKNTKSGVDNAKGGEVNHDTADNSVVAGNDDHRMVNIVGGSCVMMVTPHEKYDSSVGNQYSLQEDSLESSSEGGGSEEISGESQTVKETEDHDTDEGFDTCDDCDSVLTKLSRKSSVEALSEDSGHDKSWLAMVDSGAGPALEGEDGGLPDHSSYSSPNDSLPLDINPLMNQKLPSGATQIFQAQDMQKSVDDDTLSFMPTSENPLITISPTTIFISQSSPKREEKYNTATLTAPRICPSNNTIHKKSQVQLHQAEVMSVEDGSEVVEEFNASMIDGCVAVKDLSELHNCLATCKPLPQKVKLVLESVEAGVVTTSFRAPTGNGFREIYKSSKSKIPVRNSKKPIKDSLPDNLGNKQRHSPLPSDKNFFASDNNKHDAKESGDREICSVNSNSTKCNRFGFDKEAIDRSLQAIQAPQDSTTNSHGDCPQSHQATSRSQHSSVDSLPLHGSFEEKKFIYSANSEETRKYREELFTSTTSSVNHIQKSSDISAHDSCLVRDKFHSPNVGASNSTAASCFTPTEDTSRAEDDMFGEVQEPADPEKSLYTSLVNRIDKEASDWLYKFVTYKKEFQEAYNYSVSCLRKTSEGTATGDYLKGAERASVFSRENVSSSVAIAEDSEDSVEDGVRSEPLSLNEYMSTFNMDVTNPLDRRVEQKQSSMKNQDVLKTLSVTGILKHTSAPSRKLPQIPSGVSGKFGVKDDLCAGSGRSKVQEARGGRSKHRPQAQGSADAACRLSPQTVVRVRDVIKFWNSKAAESASTRGHYLERSPVKNYCSSSSNNKNRNNKQDKNNNRPQTVIKTYSTSKAPVKGASEVLQKSDKNTMSSARITTGNNMDDPVEIVSKVVQKFSNNRKGTGREHCVSSHRRDRGESIVAGGQDDDDIKRYGSVVRRSADSLLRQKIEGVGTLCVIGGGVLQGCPALGHSGTGTQDTHLHSQTPVVTETHSHLPMYTTHLQVMSVKCSEPSSTLFLTQ